MLEADFAAGTPATQPPPAPQPPPATQATYEPLKTHDPAAHGSQKDHTHPPQGTLVSKPQETGRSLDKGSYSEVVEVR